MITIPKSAEFCIGMKFGKLKAVEYSGKSQSGKDLVKCECECGKFAIVQVWNLRCGNSKSCGCEGSRSTIGNRSVTHGDARVGKISSAFYTWTGMLQRCYNPSNPKFETYGARGIFVCSRWTGPTGYQNFISDMGNRPAGKTIHRVNNDGPYEPNNCVWADAVVQANCKTNTRHVMLNGSKTTMAEAARKIGVTYKHLYFKMSTRSEYMGVSNL